MLQKLSENHKNTSTKYCTYIYFTISQQHSQREDIQSIIFHKYTRMYRI